jgi:hypothetical protein
LLTRGQAQFDGLITTDRNLKSQQNLSEATIAILVLPTTSWPRLRRMLSDIVSAVDAIKEAEYLELP